MLLTIFSCQLYFNNAWERMYFHTLNPFALLNFPQCVLFPSVSRYGLHDFFLLNKNVYFRSRLVLNPKYPKHDSPGPALRTYLMNYTINIFIRPSQSEPQKSPEPEWSCSHTAFYIFMFTRTDHCYTAPHHRSFLPQHVVVNAETHSWSRCSE